MALIAIGILRATVRGSEACGAPQKTSLRSASRPHAATSPSMAGIILLLSRDLSREPRSHVEPDEPLASPYIFGLNVNGLAPGRTVILDDNAFGWPAAHLSKLPSGDYLVQALLNRYEAFHLADGRNLMLPPDKGEGQQWASKPGNLYSKPMRLDIRPAAPRRAGPPRSGSRDRAPRTQNRYRVRPAHTHSQRTTVPILGARCIHRRARPAT